jgi:predicted patatin/cPLA2 family phospholipase
MPTLYDELEAHRRNKKDKRVFGLVLQGGGMRGVYSGAAFQPLAAYGFQDSFEHVVGSSAGAINGAYFMGSRPDSYKIYNRELTNKNFVNLRRRDKKIDVDYAIDIALHQKNPVDIDRLLHTHTRLHIIMTNARTGKKVVISDHHKFLEIYQELRASAALPLLYDKKIKIGDTEYVDGSVSDSLPVDVAVQLGCTDIVVIMTQQVSSIRFNRRHTRLVHHLIRRFARQSSVAVRKILPVNEKALQANLKLLSHPPKGVNIYLLQPSNEEVLLSLGTIDKSKVAAFAKLGIQDMDTFLHQLL